MKRILDELPDDLREQALTHPAFALSRAQSFERLEFLGDSVLGLAITEELYRRFPKLPEGELTRVRAAVVSRDSCEQVARGAGLGKAMVARAAAVGEAQRLNAERLANQRNALAALAESVIGASFLTHGYEAVSRHVVAAFEDRIAHALDNRVDARSQLQELASQTGADIEWDEPTAEGPPHERTFSVAVAWTSARDGATAVDAVAATGEDMDVLRASGSGRSKQEAQHAAAAALLALIGQGTGEE